jgi:DASS family divalent anion:Na+ symporter
MGRNEIEIRAMKSKIRFLKILFSFGVGALLWFGVSAPAGLEHPQAWHLLAIFLATITAVIVDALPMGASTLLGLSAAVATGTLSFKDAFSGYSNDVTWLIVLAFFISHGFIETGLGRRVAYFFIAAFGKSSVGLGFGLTLSELCLAPAIPSMTARTGAVVYPIAQALSHSFDSRVEDGTRKRIGTYLVAVTFQAAVVTSAMFMTAMAGNPLVAKLALQAGVELTWTSWATYALVPGMCSLAVIPFIIFFLAPPEIKKTPDAAAFARKHLKDMGPMKTNELLMAFTFVGLLVLWIFGKSIGIDAVTAALLGLAFLLISGVLKWEELLRIHSAWETFVWFGALVAMADGLNKMHLTTWFGENVAELFAGTNWMVAAAGLLIVYFYSHYLFASSTAHIGALYLPFLLVLIKVGAPPLESALILGFASNLYMGLTHYGCGPAPILFGSGFLSLKEWWGIGAVLSVVNLLIWVVVGGLWWTWLSQAPLS